MCSRMSNGHLASNVDAPIEYKYRAVRLKVAFLEVCSKTPACTKLFLYLLFCFVFLINIFMGLREMTGLYQNQHKPIFDVI